jgi:hypothetical protein
MIVYNSPWGQDGIVSTVGLMMCGLIVGGGKRLFLVRNVQASSGAHPVYCSVSTGPFFFMVKWMEHKFDHLPPSGIKDDWNCIFTASVCLHDMHMNNFIPLYFTFPMATGMVCMTLSVSPHPDNNTESLSEMELSQGWLLECKWKVTSL